jgi:DNA-binding NarL/FixJ family response regulator
LSPKKIKPIVDQHHMPTTKPRLVLADDYRDLLAELVIVLEKDFNVVATANDGVDLVSAVREHRPDAVVTDAKMPRLSGIQASREILNQKLCPAIVLLTVHNERDLVDAALLAGIRGYVLKMNAREELVPAVRDALCGLIFISRSVSR